MLITVRYILLTPSSNVDNGEGVKEKVLPPFFLTLTFCSAILHYKALNIEKKMEGVVDN